MDKISLEYNEMDKSVTITLQYEEARILKRLMELYIMGAMPDGQWVQRTLVELFENEGIV